MRIVAALSRELVVAVAKRILHRQISELNERCYAWLELCVCGIAVQSTAKRNVVLRYIRADENRGVAILKRGNRLRHIMKQKRDESDRGGCQRRVAAHVLDTRGIGDAFVFYPEPRMVAIVAVREN
jgi:hypothetical protein